MAACDASLTPFNPSTLVMLKLAVYRRAPLRDRSISE